MSFKINALYLTDGYKIGHKEMLADDVKKLYGTWIPRSTKHAPNGCSKIVSFGQQLAWKWLNDEFSENFFSQPIELAADFGKDMSQYLGLEYNYTHFEELHKLGYLPIKVKSLEEGVETLPNTPHMTIINTVDGFGWLTLYLETVLSSLLWKPSTSATIALQYNRVANEWMKKTDEKNLWLVDYMCHDFSARGMSPWDMVASGLGHATSFRGSDTLPVIPAARYFYNEPKDHVCINSVNASEHSVSTTKIFTVGEKQMLSDWMKTFPKGILSVVSDTFDLWKLISEYLTELKEEILSRDGKLVIRPDSGNPVDIICGCGIEENGKFYKVKGWDKKEISRAEHKGVIETLWEIFGGSVNEQGFKVLDSHIGAIYGDSINLERQLQIYQRLADKGFAATNIVLGIGSFTYQFNTRDTFGFAMKGSWFNTSTSEFGIYKDPVTDDGTKKSYKGLIQVKGGVVKDQCTHAEEEDSDLKTIFIDGKFVKETSLSEIRSRIKSLI